MFNKKAKNQNEIEEFVQSFSQEPINPRKGFKEELKAQFLSEVKHKNNFSGYNMFKSFNLKLAGILSAVLVFLSLASVGGYYLYSTRFTLSDEEILRRIYLSNSPSALSQNNQASGRLSSKAFAAENNDMLSMIFFEDREFSYIKTETDYQKGPSADKCPAVTDWIVSDKTENVDYMGSGENYIYYSKSIEYYKDDVIGYYLSRPDDYYEYRGGDYAVRTIYGSKDIMIMESDGQEDYISDNREISYDDMEEPVAVEPTIEELYGPNATLSQVTIDGKKYYAITYNSYIYCDSEMLKSVSSYISSFSDIVEEGETIIMRLLADKDTFEVVKYEQYWETVSPENLILASSSTSTKKNVSFEEVKSEFEFDINVKVKEIRQDNEADINRLKKVLKDKKINLIVPNDAYYPTWIYPNVVDESYNYLQDRHFYAKDSKGQELYDLSNKYIWVPDDDFVSSIINASFAEDITNLDLAKLIDIAIYEGNVSDDAIMKSFYYHEADKTRTDINVSVDGKKVTARMYEISMDYPVSIMPYQSDAGGSSVDGSSSNSEGSSIDGSIGVIDREEVDCKQTPEGCAKILLVIFAYDGNVYTLTLNNVGISEPFSKAEIEAIKLVSIKASDTAGIDSLFNRIEEYEKRNYGGGDMPVVVY